jgi:hypothetical protein
MDARERAALDDHITGHGGEDSLPEDLIAYRIEVEDHGDRIAWVLYADDERVKGGTVEAGRFAWGSAFVDANNARQKHEAALAPDAHLEAAYEDRQGAVEVDG